MSTLFPLFRIFIKLILGVFINIHQFIYFIFQVYIVHFYVTYIFNLFHVLNKSDNIIIITGLQGTSSGNIIFQTTFNVELSSLSSNIKF